MRLTDIRLSLLKQPKGRVRAVASLVFDDELAIHDVLIIEGDRGPFVSFPARKTPDGEYRDTISFLSSRLHQDIQSQILRAYEDECARPAPGTGHP